MVARKDTDTAYEAMGILNTVFAELDNRDSAYALRTAELQDVTRRLGHTELMLMDERHEKKIWIVAAAAAVVSLIITLVVRI